MNTLPTDPKHPFILVDGSSYLHRAFHALPPLVNSQGQPTGAAYGVINMLRKLINEYNPTYLVVVFDAKGKTFRNDLYPQYKANRAAMHNDLVCQIEPLHALIRAMGVPLLMIEGVEADDVIGTLVKEAKQRQWHCLISTGDKDFAQMVDSQVTLINTMNNTLLDEAGVVEKFGVTAAQIIDYLAIVGDTVDNVPGVSGVGPKTAVKWLQQYGSLDALLKDADNVTGKVGENLRAALDYLPLAKKLVSIDCDVKLPVTLDELNTKEQNKQALLQWLEKLEFKSWLKDVEGVAQPKAPAVTAQYDCILSWQDLDAWLEKLKKAKIFAIDTETDNLDVMRANIVGLSFAVSEYEAAYVPLAHQYDDVPAQLRRDEVLQKIKPLLEDKTFTKIGHHIKYDINLFSRYDIIVQGFLMDTLLEGFILSAGNRNDMDSLALKYLDYRTISYDEVTGKGAKRVTFDKVALDKAAAYAAEDADVTLRLHHYFYPRLQQQPVLLKVYETIEEPVIKVIARMEQIGVLIDGEKLQQQSIAFEKQLRELEESAFKLSGTSFNINSPKQLQEVLFEKMGLPILEKTPTGQASTAESVLQELAHDFPLPKIILEYRSISKLKSTYTDTLPLQINPYTGRVHTSYHQVGAATGRLSSSNPNLQNIPTRNVEGQRIRQAFIAPPGYVLLDADYSQIELRIMAHLSQDEGLRKAFAEGLDIHCATAAEVFGVERDAVTSLQRRHAKAINFGLIYGMSAFGLARQLDVDNNTAKRYMDLYFERYPGVARYMEQTRLLAREQGYVETIWGRRLYLPDIQSKNKGLQRAAERAAINAPMQGSAADIIKQAMIRVDAAIVKDHIAARMIMQVHDELVLEVRKDHLELAQSALRTAMEGVAQLSVPLVVDMGYGDNWGVAHEG
ncbi:MAG: polymerase [Gammaproteobacteria bacterium]|nr:polymerase [Gammaproteobacteria bacterium]